MEQAENRSIIKGLKVVPILPFIFICIVFLLNLFYSLPIKDSLLWYAGVFLYFYIPGNLLLRCLDFNKDEYFVNFFHSIALGAALMPLVYMIFRRISHPELLYIFGIVMFLIWFIFNVRDFKNSKSNVYTSYIDILSALMLIATVLLLLHLSHFTDVVFLENGFKFRVSDAAETDYHLGIINNLRDMYPPLYLYASSTGPFYYHINMHLEIEMINRLFSIDILKLTFFYFPLMYFCLLVFIPYVFIRKFWGMRFLGLLTGILMFGSDLSFIPGWIGDFKVNVPWTAFFKSTIWSLLTLNGLLPALFVMFLCVLHLKKFYEDGRLPYLVVFALLGFSAFGFKSSMGPHIMGAAFLTGIASVVFMKDRKRGMLLCAVSVLTALAMAADITLLGGGTRNTIFSIDLFDNFYRSLKILGVSDVSWIFYPVIYLLYIIAAFGVRALGFYLLKDIFGKKFFDPIVVFLIIFSLSGFFLSEVTYLGIYSGSINNAAWFCVQSLMGAWLLLFFFLRRIGQFRKKFLACIFIVIILSAPSTVQFLTLRFNSNYYTLDSHAIEVIQYLETTPPQSVILYPPNVRRPSLASNFAGRQSVYSLFHSFVPQTRGKIEANNRLKDIALFFKSNDVGKMPFILKKYKVNYVYAPLKYATRLDNETSLVQILKNGKYVLYKVNM